MWQKEHQKRRARDPGGGLSLTAIGGIIVASLLAAAALVLSRRRA